MKYTDFIKIVDQTYNQFNWRYGQTIMNVLHGVWPSKYNELVSKENDCYYNDSLVNNTLDILSRDWPSDYDQTKTI